MTRLSSGERINQAADDAAGMAVSEKLQAQIRSINMAKRNANDGISIVQTAEGGLSEVSSMLVRLRELSIQAASDTIGNKERALVDNEFLQLKDEINRIANTTSFNGTQLLIGSNEQLPKEMNSANEFPLEIQVGSFYAESIDGKDQASPFNVIRIDFEKINSFTEGEEGLDLGKGEEGARVFNREEAQKSIGKLDNAIHKVSDYRSYLGSVQNRLTSAISNIEIYSENLSQTHSRIRDTDFAEETAQYTQNNILQQAGTSILSNANAQPQVVLSLLKS